MLRTFFLALVGTAAFAAVYVATAPKPKQLPETPTKTASLPDAPRVDPAPIGFELRPTVPDNSAPTGESLSASIRDVTPANMTAAPSVAAPPERAEPIPPETSSTASGRRERIFNPVIDAAGSIRIEGRTIRLTGIAAPDVEKRCGAESESWPCGRIARAALRRFIRGRAVECEVPEGAEAIPDVARCFVAGEDISAWLVAQGWAERSGEAYADAEQAARDGKLGVWSAGWPEGQAAEVATGD